MAWAVDKQLETPFGEIAWGSSGDGPPLVLAHGWPWSSFSWHRIIPMLETRYRVYWFDMVGYGRSSKSADLDTALDTQGKLFGHMLQHWALDRPVVWAHDFGGAVSLRAHLLDDIDYERVVLMNVVALSPWGSAFFDHVGKHIDAFRGLPPHIHEAIVRAYINGALASGLDPDDIEGLVAPWLDEEGSRSFYEQFARADDKYTSEFFDALGSLRCPVDVVWGADDPWIPIDRGQRLHSLIPNSSFTQLDGAGHLPQLEKPDDLHRAVSSLLSV